MISLPTIQDKPQSINSAIGTNSPAGFKQRSRIIPIFFIISVFCVIGLLVTFDLIFQFPSLQPSIEQATLLLGG
jgi:hypothetical protein